MQTKDSNTNPGGARTVDEQKRLPFVDELTVLVTTEASHKGGNCACVRIHHANEILRDLLLSDDLAFGKTLVIGVVATRLDEIASELESLEGMQRLYELWVGNGT